MGVSSYNTNIPISSPACSLFLNRDIGTLFDGVEKIAKNWMRCSLMTVATNFSLKGIPSCNVSLPIGTCVYDPAGRQTGKLHKTTLRSNLSYDFLPCVVIKHSCNKRELTNDKTRSRSDQRGDNPQVIFRGVLQSESVKVASQRIWQNTITIHHWAALLAASQISSTFMNSVSAGAPSQYGLAVMFGTNRPMQTSNNTGNPKPTPSSGDVATPSADLGAIKNWMSGKNGTMSQSNVLKLAREEGVDAMIIRLLLNLATDQSQAWKNIYFGGDAKVQEELIKRAETAKKVVNMLLNRIDKARELPTHVKALGNYVSGASGQEVCQRIIDGFVSYAQNNRFSANYWDLLNTFAKQVDLNVICTVNEITIEPCMPMQKNPLELSPKKYISDVLSTTQTQAHSRPIIGAQLVASRGSRQKGTVATDPSTPSSLPATSTEQVAVLANVNFGGMYCPPLSTSAKFNSFGSIAYFRAPSWVTLTTNQQSSTANPDFKRKTVKQLVEEQTGGKSYSDTTKLVEEKKQTSLKITSLLTEKYYWDAINRLRKLTITMPLTLNFCPAQQVLVALDVLLTGVVYSVSHSIDANNNQMGTSVTITYVSEASEENEDYNLLVTHPIYDNSYAFSGRNLVADSQEY